MGRRDASLATLMLALLAAPADAALHHKSHARSRHVSGISQRKRLHINDVIAERGTVELDWGVLYSLTSGYGSAPSAVRYTPGGGSQLWGRTEYSVAFDSLAREVNGGASYHFSDRVTLAATSVVFDGEHFDVAIGPQVSLFLRNESGSRLGGTAIFRYDRGLNSVGSLISWSGATAPTDANPAGVWDFASGYGRQLATKGFVSHFTLHCTAQLERSSGFDPNWAVFAGVEYQVSPRFAIDFSGQQYGLNGVAPDRQLLLSLTINLGGAH